MLLLGHQRNKWHFDLKNEKLRKVRLIYDFRDFDADLTETLILRQLRVLIYDSQKVL